MVLRNQPDDAPFTVPPLDLNKLRARQVLEMMVETLDDDTNAIIQLSNRRRSLGKPDDDRQPVEMREGLQLTNEIQLPLVGKVLLQILHERFLKDDSVWQRPILLGVVKHLNPLASHAQESARIQLPQTDAGQALVDADRLRELDDARLSMRLDHRLQQPQPRLVHHRPARPPKRRSKFCLCSLFHARIIPNF